MPINLNDQVHLHRVEALPEEAALCLLLQEARRTVLAQALSGEQSAEARAARALCQAVGNLPLGLVHLRRQLARDPLLSVAELEQAVKELGAFAVASSSYPDAPSLFASFSLSWQQIKDPGAKQLFYLAGFFPEAAPMPLWLLGLAAGLDERWDGRRALREARLALQEQSLLEPVAEGQIRLHPLVREFA